MKVCGGRVTRSPLCGYPGKRARTGGASLRVTISTFSHEPPRPSRYLAFHEFLESRNSVLLTFVTRGLPGLPSSQSPAPLLWVPHMVPRTHLESTQIFVDLNSTKVLECSLSDSGWMSVCYMFLAKPPDANVRSYRCVWVQLTGGLNQKSRVTTKGRHRTAGWWRTSARTA